jgi:hypothetical protein
LLVCNTSDTTVIINNEGSEKTVSLEAYKVVLIMYPATNLSITADNPILVSFAIPSGNVTNSQSSLISLISNDSFFIFFQFPNLAENNSVNSLVLIVDSDNLTSHPNNITLNGEPVKNVT